MTPIAQTLAALHIGPAQTSAGLTLFPLLMNAPVARQYLLLDEALASGIAEISEVSQDGAVPELKFLNRCDRDILLIDGEELVGAKQNRVINLSIMVGADASVSIPVSCVESGRWSWRSKRFTAGGRKLHASARSIKMRGVSEALARANVRAARDIQRTVWRSIDEKLDAYGARSSTAALHDAYEHAEERLAPVRSSFSPVPGQVGAAFATGGRIVGVELFDVPTTLSKMLPKLIDSYAFDLLEPEPGAELETFPVPDRAQVSQLLKQIAAAEPRQYPAVGKGSDLRVDSPGLHAAALVVDGRLAHLSAFPG